MNTKDAAYQSLRQEQARVQAVATRIAQLRAAHGQSASLRGTAARLGLLQDVYERFESIALPKGEFGRVSITPSSDREAELCCAIDEALEQVAQADPKSNRWDIQLQAAMELIEDFAVHQLANLESVLKYGARAAPAPRTVGAVQEAAEQHRAAA